MKVPQVLLPTPLTSRWTKTPPKLARTPLAAGQGLKDGCPVMKVEDRKIHTAAPISKVGKTLPVLLHHAAAVAKAVAQQLQREKHLRKTSLRNGRPHRREKGSTRATRLCIFVCFLLVIISCLCMQAWACDITIKFLNLYLLFVVFNELKHHSVQ